MNPSGLASSRMELMQVKNGAAAGVSSIHDIVSGIQNDLTKIKG